MARKGGWHINVHQVPEQWTCNDKSSFNKGRAAMWAEAKHHTMCEHRNVLRIERKEVWCCI